MNKEEIEELKDFTIDLTDIDELTLGLEVCSKKSNMVIQEFADTIIQLQQENQKYKEVIDKATDKCNKTLGYINNTLLENNVKVELTELLKIKGGLDIILESLVEDQLKRWNK